MEEVWKVPSDDISGRVALITGASQGLGYGMAIALAEKGADIIVAGLPSNNIETVVKEIEALGRRALAAPCDISTISGIEDLVSFSIEKMGRINILVNNAGVGITKRATEVTEKEWDFVLNLNLKSVFFLSQAVAKHFIERKYDKGNIINIASAGGVRQDPNLAPYYSSKAAAIQLTKVLALEWARHNIRVNCVCPGYVVTPLNEEEFSDPAVREKILSHVPLRRLGQIGEIAGIVAYLASDVSRYATGGVFIVDGGYVIG